MRHKFQKHNAHAEPKEAKHLNIRELPNENGNIFHSTVSAFPFDTRGKQS